MYNYRICLASSNYYYVQKKDSFGSWKRTGGFFKSRPSAERFIRDLKDMDCRCLPTTKVVAYY